MFVSVQMSASAHALHLPTNSVRVFWGQSNLQSWMNSDSSLCAEEQVMKLGRVRPPELASGGDKEGEVLKYGGYWC